MKDVKILGGGCANCGKLYHNAEEAAQNKGIECSFEKITDFKVIAEYGVMRTPALVVDGKVVVSGKVATVKEIEELLG
jgi:small redox-active disulfide protein 2